jgi:hypothetical protein
MRLILIKILLVGFVLKFNSTVAQDKEFRFGLIGKLEFNRLKIENTDNVAQVKYQPGAMGAGGLYTAVNLGQRWFLDASVLLSRAKYTVNYSRLNSTFIDADVRFTEMNLNLNLILNPNSENVHLFLFGGGQLLYRRWGEERFINNVIDKSYWPSSRFMAQAGLGAKCAIGNGFYLQPFAGFRYALEQQLVYDASMNQVFAGLVLCYGIKGKPKNRYNKCPTDF